MELEKKNVAIIGLGLLGTSLGLALKGKCRRLAWARRKESLDYALKMDACDEILTDVKSALSMADITVLCLPVKTIISFSEENIAYFKTSSVVTDVGSVKRRIVSELEPLLKKYSVNFVGSHPMAGSEQSGAEAARVDMYKNALVFITPTEDTDLSSISEVCRMWELCGARTLKVFPELHDRTVALSSHLVHLSAAVLAKTVLSSDGNGKDSLSGSACAGGFRDSTRVAVSSPEMWSEIVEFNSDNLVLFLKKLEEEICEIRKTLEKKDFEKVLLFLEKASELRKTWRHRSEGKI